MDLRACVLNKSLLYKKLESFPNIGKILEMYVRLDCISVSISIK